MKKYNVAIVGATGVVGEEIRKLLEEREFPIGEIKLLASAKSAGRKVSFQRKAVIIKKLEGKAFKGVDIALFSAGSSVSKEVAPLAVQKGAVVVDNSNAFRMKEGVPLVVPEVNAEEVENHQGIIANPNCSTIQMVVVLKPLHDEAKIKRIVVSTYQSVSGTGRKAMKELISQSKAYFAQKPLEKKVYPYQIAFNVLPHIDVFLENAYTKEEQKMVDETRKILRDSTLRITVTAVRVPVLVGHSEAVNVETERKITADEAREILRRAPGVAVIDEPEENEYPLPLLVAGRDESFVGRIREDESIAKGLNLWIVSDNLRKGAALNAVQIAELLIEKGVI